MQFETDPKVPDLVNNFDANCDFAKSFHPSKKTTVDVSWATFHCSIDCKSRTYASSSRLLTISSNTMHCRDTYSKSGCEVVHSLLALVESRSAWSNVKVNDRTNGKYHNNVKLLFFTIWERQATWKNFEFWCFSFWTDILRSPSVPDYVPCRAWDLPLWLAATSTAFMTWNNGSDWIQNLLWATATQSSLNLVATI